RARLELPSLCLAVSEILAFDWRFRGVSLWLRIFNFRFGVSETGSTWRRDRFGWSRRSPYSWSPILRSCSAHEYWRRLMSPATARSAAQRLKSPSRPSEAPLPHKLRHALRRSRCLFDITRSVGPVRLRNNLVMNSSLIDAGGRLVAASWRTTATVS